jgi:hypothetical protein
MKLPRVRLTIRWILLAVAAMGVGLGIAVPIGSHHPGSTPLGQLQRTLIIAPIVAVSPLLALIVASIWIRRRQSRPSLRVLTETPDVSTRLNRTDP